MNINHVLSLDAAADLTGKEYSVVKMTSTGINLAAAGDAILGSLLRAQPHQEDGVYTGKSVAIQTWPTGIHYVRVGASTAAVTKGDALAIDPANPGKVIPAGANRVVAISVQTFTAVQDAVVEVIFVAEAGEDAPLVVPQAAIAAVTTADGSDAGTTQALANALKAKLNTLLTELRSAGIIAP